MGTGCRFLARSFALGIALVGCSSAGGDHHEATATEVQAVYTPTDPLEAPAIDWGSIGRSAPVPLDIPAREPAAPLPNADVVILTWTSAEWSALDHVFVNSTTARSPSDHSWQSAWQIYTRNASGFSTGGYPTTLWGSFRLVQVDDLTHSPQRVLLFHSNAHLSYAPFIGGLRAMVQNILSDAQPRAIYSIGTAGGARLDQRLGDSVVTNSAFLQATLPQNASDPANGQTFTSYSFPAVELEHPAERLMVPLSEAATPQDLLSLFDSVVGTSSGIAPSDLINFDLTSLDHPRVHSMPFVPLNSSDDYGMAPGDGRDPYSAYESDDAVVAQAAIVAHVEYASIRDVSDPVVPSTTASGASISDSMRASWASAVYYRYGFLTAVNGAIATWATIAGGCGPWWGCW